MAQVSLNQVRKMYAGAIEAVKGVSLFVPDGGFCVLVGPSGCGKSTLLRMIAGLETITSGEIRIGERVVNDIEPSDRDIAMVFQNYALYPHMNVYENMAYGLKNRGTPKAEIEKRVNEAARILGLEPYLARRPRQLSGGQRQRVAMGRAIVRKPQVFLFDEPLSNLDAKLRVQMRVEIKKLQRALGVTSIYVTHDQVEAMTLSDVLVVMSNGAVEQIGTPTEVYRRPASRFVATFMGSPAMNILIGEVDAAGVVKTRDVVVGAMKGLAPGPRKVEIGLRPEEIVLVAAQTPGSVPITVDFVEELGATQLVHGVLAGQTIIVQVASGFVTPQMRTICVQISPDFIHLFDIETGKRLEAGV